MSSYNYRVLKNIDQDAKDKPEYISAICHKNFFLSDLYSGNKTFLMFKNIKEKTIRL